MKLQCYQVLHYALLIDCTIRIISLQCYQLHLLGDYDDTSDDAGALTESPAKSPAKSSSKTTSKPKADETKTAAMDTSSPSSSPSSTAVDVLEDVADEASSKRGQRKRKQRPKSLAKSLIADLGGGGDASSQPGEDVADKVAVVEKISVGQSVLALWGKKWLTVKVVRVEVGTAVGAEEEKGEGVEYEGAEEEGGGVEYEVKHQGSTWVVTAEEIKIPARKPNKQAAAAIAKVTVKVTGKRAAVTKRGAAADVEEVEEVVSAPKASKKRRTAKKQTAKKKQPVVVEEMAEEGVCFVCSRADPEYMSTELDDEILSVPVCCVGCESKYLESKGYYPKA
jgi:PHD/YefM family antitoxin component YafN of YafNO toxin-antitoxin module